MIMNAKPWPQQHRSKCPRTGSKRSIRVLLADTLTDVCPIRVRADGGHELLNEALKALDLSWPPADFDLEAERARVAAL